MDTPCHNSDISQKGTPDVDAGAAPMAPPHHGACQLGGTVPRTVIRGESFNNSSTQPDARAVIPDPSVPAVAALTDWLNCTFPLRDIPELIGSFFYDFCNIVGDHFAPMTERGRGLHGWKRSFVLGNTKALFGIGGQRGTALLSMPGEACALIKPELWPLLASLLDDKYQARITRWDGAVDDFEGDHSVDWAVEQYLADQFNNGGNRPSCKQHGNWIEPDGTGRTFEVGRRKNGKLIRIYEKGKQLGDTNSLWVRWEVELHNKDRVIPWDVLLNPGGYVAGAYPCTSWVSESMCRIKTAKKTAQIGYNALTFHAKRGYGALINVMMEVEGSPEKVIECLIRPGTPSRLEIPDARKLLTDRK